MTWEQSFVCSDMKWEYEIDGTDNLRWATEPWLVFAPTHHQRGQNGDIVSRHWNARLSPNLFPAPFAWSGMYCLGGQTAHVDGAQEWSFSLNVPDPDTFRVKEIWAGVPRGFYEGYGVSLRGYDELALWKYSEFPSPYRKLSKPSQFVTEVPESVTHEIEDRIARLQRWIDSMRMIASGPVPTMRTRTDVSKDIPHPTQCPVCLGRTPGYCKCVPYWGRPEEYPTWAELQETLSTATWNNHKMLWEKLP